MGQVVQFPQRRSAKLYGLFTNNDVIAGQHMVRQRKAKYVYTGDLPDVIRCNKLGEYAIQGLKVEGYAINEFEQLCTYLLEQPA